MNFLMWFQLGVVVAFRVKSYVPLNTNITMGVQITAGNTVGFNSNYSFIVSSKMASFVEDPVKCLFNLSKTINSGCCFEHDCNHTLGDCSQRCQSFDSVQQFFWSEFDCGTTNLDHFHCSNTSVDNISITSKVYY